MGAPVQVRRYCYAEMFMTATFGNYGRVNRNCHLVISRSFAGRPAEVPFYSWKTFRASKLPIAWCDLYFFAGISLTVVRRFHTRGRRLHTKGFLMKLNWAGH